MRLITIAITLIAIPYLSAAQENDAVGYPTGAEFLNANTDTRSAGMGNLRTTPVPDANSVFSNPARIAFPSSELLHDVGITYNPLAAGITSDIKLLSLSTNHYVGGGELNASYLSGFLQYLTYGDVFFTDEQGNESDYFKPYEMAVGAGYIQRFGYFSLGLNAKAIYSRLGANRVSDDGTNGIAFAVDVGGYGELPLNSDDNLLHLGLTFSNIGTPLGYGGATQKSLLPQTLRLGLGYRSIFDGDNSYLFIGVDWNKPLIPMGYDPAIDGTNIFDALSRSFANFSGSGVSAGAEIVFQDRFGIRTGYTKEPDHYNRLNYFTVGLSLGSFFGYNRLAIDAAYLIPSGNDGVGSGSLLKLGLSFQVFE